MLVQVYGDNAMKKTAVYKRVARFSEGTESVTDEAVRSIAEQVNISLSGREFFASKQITVLEHPPSSPDLAPNDFFLFSKTMETLKGRHFDDIDDIRSNTAAALKAVPQNQFKNCFEGWTRRWHRCIASQGEFFEGDHSDIQQGAM
ncbi:hypothetical protein B7P43_G03017 [Cryptotermes secundus]|uniref:Uncharacterized protein n=1 Tax=Cryptotermes secundus TaxID=105785 RepID=A0A2J7PWC9_9NEOP|nr:hypothetical protein B7P43_G03017 [Cryptotermes secundus]